MNESRALALQMAVQTQTRPIFLGDRAYPRAIEYTAQYVLEIAKEYERYLDGFN